MWLELWNMARWLLGFWLLVIAVCAVIAATRVRPQLTLTQLERISATPEQVFEALNLEMNDSLFEKCVTYTGDVSSFLQTLERLPDSLFVLPDSFESSLNHPAAIATGRVSFNWHMRDGVDAHYMGFLEFGWRQKRFCLEAGPFSMQSDPVSEQWQRHFENTRIAAFPWFPLGLSAFALTLWLTTKYTILRWFGALVFFPSMSLTLFIGYWYFLFSIGLQ
jgi:hypothetical protein